MALVIQKSTTIGHVGSVEATAWRIPALQAVWSAVPTHLHGWDWAAAL